MGLLWFVLPPALILVAPLVARRYPRLAVNPLALTLASALIASGGVYALASYSERWRGRTEVVWLGIDAPGAGADARLGGDPGGFTLGWPSGHAWPEVTIRAANGKARITVHGGGGLVEAGEKAVNGRDLALGSDLAIDAFRIRVVDPWLGRMRAEIRLLSPATAAGAGWLSRVRNWWAGTDPALAEFPVSRPRSGVLPVAPLVARRVMELRRGGEADDLQRALALEQWASRLALALGTQGALRVLVDRPTETGIEEGLPLPLTVTVRWPQRVLRAQVFERDQKLYVSFLPPWRTTSPMPPRAKPDAAIPLVITPDPRPGDIVFDLPFGRGVQDLRLSATIVKHPTGGDVFEGAPKPDATLMVPPGSGRVAEARHYFTERVQSTTCVAAQPVQPCIGLARDIVQPAPIVEVLVVALMGLAAAVWLIGPLLQRVPISAWAVAVVLAAVWNLFAVRLLLALRYGLDPAGLDAMAVGGVAMASGALVLVPACLAGTVILYRERFVVRTAVQQRSRFWWLAGALVVSVLAALVESRRIRALWPNLPAEFDNGVPSGLLVLAALLLAAGVLGIIHQLLLDGAEQSRWRWTSANHMPLSALRWLTDLWRESRDLRHSGRFWLIPALALWTTIAVMAIGFRALAGAVGETKLLTEFLFPIVIGTGCVLFWVAALQAFKPGTNYKRQPLPAGRELVFPAIAFVAIPAMVPVFLGDSGGLFSMLGLFVPLGLLLAFSRHPRFGAAVLGGCAVIVVALSLTIRHVSNLPARAISLSERGAARVTAYVHGNDVQRMLPMARVLSDAGDGLPAGALRGALEHPWETRAIVYRAGWVGPGYGLAPNRRSEVPQSVLQYDSTFSFFVAGDFGLLGGLGLFLLYCCPLAAVLIAARRRVDAGHVVAIVGCAWLLNEAVVHAAVNLGAIPFTGRNLPLLSVNSSADLLRWTTTFWLVLLGMLWRTTGSEFLFSDDVAPITADPQPPQRSAGIASSLDRPEIAYGGVAVGVVPAPVAGVLNRVRQWQLVRVVPAPVTAVAVSTAVVLLTLVVAPGARVLRQHTELGDPFDWTPFFREVQRYLDEGLLKWDASTWTLDASPLAERGVRLDGTSLLEQEIARFNALPRDEKAELPASVAAQLSRVRTVQDYDTVIEQLRRLDATRPPRPNVLFQVVRQTIVRDDGREQVIEFPRVDSASNTSVSFAADTDVEMIPSVRLRDRRERGRVVPGRTVVGSAWVSGRWQALYEIGSPLPWAEALRNAVEAEWGRRDRTDTRQRFESLTIEEGLQTAATNFVAVNGRSRHTQLLAGGMHAGDPYKALPPRVALTILTLPNGEVLASGGWPRMTAARGWRGSSAGLLPPASWLSTRAPGPIAYRYAGDRNFDPIEMGSATKPLWAAAALRVHPQIRQLRTRGPAGREREVFGIPVEREDARGWTVPPAADWVGFQQYLARSDNRYHVRLGFLALAEVQQGRFAEDGTSTSALESIAVRGGEPAPWRRVPRFVPEIGFSRQQPQRMQDLNRTHLAREIRQMFGVSVEPGDYDGRRRSLWTLNEEDDRFGAPRGALSQRFAQISPSLPHLALHRVRRPREFVSLLLGGDENRWSNVDFAAAFGTVVTGHPVIPHIVPGRTSPWSGRTTFPETAALLRPGLADTIRDGTATRALQATGALQWMRSMNLTAYAKTGTLSTDGGRTETSRLVIALVRWSNEKEGRVAQGLVLSLVVERASAGVAAAWLSEFIADNRTELARHLQ